MITKHDGLTVSEFIKQLKDVIDHHPSFNNVTLIGELSNFKAHSSGHFYFTLKDEGSRINCVMFRSQSQKVLFRPKDGDKVIVSGRVEVYEAAGSIQLYASRMNLDGLGDLYIQFEALKKRFFEQGYFDVKHKKPFPEYPKHIGVIVGAGSAAYHDIEKTLRSRWPLSKIDFKFAAVQGKEAIVSICSRIQELNDGNYDAIILARGGGSIEDLWAFNEEAVVNAIYNSKVPIVSGVGHESDTTLADYVADLRAATPTAAAVAITPDIIEVRSKLRNYKNNAYMKVKSALQRDAKTLNMITMKSPLSNPIYYIERKQMVLDILQSRIMNQVRHFEASKRAINNLNIQMSRSIDSRLNKYSTDLRLTENALVSLIDSKMNNQTMKLHNQETLLLTKAKNISYIIHNLSQKNQQFTQTNTVLIKQLINLKKNASIDIIRRISTNNPMEKLASIYERGFARVTHNTHKITSINQVETDDTVSLELKDGLVVAKVTGKESL